MDGRSGLLAIKSWVEKERERGEREGDLCKTRVIATRMLYLVYAGTDCQSRQAVAEL